MRLLYCLILWLAYFYEVPCLDRDLFWTDLVMHKRRKYLCAYEVDRIFFYINECYNLNNC